MDRQAFADDLIATNGWPDMEGLIRDIYVGHARHGDAMLDVGVNHGVHFLQMAAAVGPQGQVIGFEAAPEMCRQTLETIATSYPELAERTTLIQKAVSSASGRSSFYFSKINDSGLSSLAKREVLAEGQYEKIDVDLVTLDESLPQSFLKRLSFAKFDVEGAEFDAFKGAEKLFRRQALLTFEWDSSAPLHFNYKPNELFEFVTGHDYRIFDLFGFHYASTAEFVEARPWNFVAVPAHMSPEIALKPSLETMSSYMPNISFKVRYSTNPT